MKIEILDYNSKRVEAEVSDELLATPGVILEIVVVYGDERLKAHYKIAGEDFACDIKWANFPTQPDMFGFDGVYPIWDPADGVDLIHNERWVKRKDSYQYLW